MQFHDIRFPARLSYGAKGGPERRTDVVALVNGHEERNTPWAHGRRRYDAGGGLCSLDDMAETVAFFEARRGRLHGFRWKDWSDFKSCLPSATPMATDQQIGQGDGEQTVFQLRKRYGTGEGAYIRPITRPVAGTVRVALDGAEVLEGGAVTIDPATGRVTFATPPAAGSLVTAGFEFDVPVRFDTDYLATSLATFEAGGLPDIPVVELREGAL